MRSQSCLQGHHPFPHRSATFPLLGGRHLLGNQCLYPGGGLMGAVLLTLTSCLVWVWSLVSSGKEESEGTIWVQL